MPARRQQLIRPALIGLLVPSLLVGATATRSTALGAPDPAPGLARSIELRHLASFRTGVFDESAAEIVDYDPRTRRMVAIGADEAVLRVVDISDPTAPVELDPIDLTPWGAVVNSVAVRDGLVVVAVEAAFRQDPGSAVFFTVDGEYLASVPVGANPDMLTFTPNGRRVLVANEGEPSSYLPGGVDPEGTISIIDLPGRIATLGEDDVRTVGFTDFNEGGPRHDELDPAIRIFGPGASVAQDLEPEYIAVSPDSQTAWVALQENNALAIIDIADGTVTELVALGRKDHRLPGNALDASDEDGIINIANWPVYGLYMPDGIAAYRSRGETFVVTANEGDARTDWPGYDEEARVEDLELEPAGFPGWDLGELQAPENLGRLTVSIASGDPDGDEVYEELYAFGARSFAIWTADGELVFDSGEDFEQITAAAFADDFNSTNSENDSFDGRSDNKGPEPEGVEIGEVRGRTYAFIGLERTGGVMVYDVTDPTDPTFVQYTNPRHFDGDPEADTAGDLGPEGLTFVPASASPIGNPLLLVGNEVSGSVSIFEVVPVMP